MKNQLVELTVAVLDGVNESAAFPASEVLPLLCSHLDAPSAVLQRVDWLSGESQIVLYGSPNDCVPQLQQATRQLRHTHPLLVAAAAGELDPATAQDVAGGWAAWQRSPTRAFVAQLLSRPQMASLALRGDDRKVVGLAFVRSGRDFSGRDLAFLSDVQPVLQALDRHLGRLQAWRNSLPSGPASPTAAAAAASLTGREIEVLLLLSEGLTAAACAHRLGCSPRTVHAHTARIFRKLEVHDRPSAVLEAQRRGLLHLPRIATT